MRPLLNEKVAGDYNLLSELYDDECVIGTYVFPYLSSPRKR